MTAIAIQKFSLVAFLISLIKSLFRRAGYFVQAIQSEDVIENSVAPMSKTPAITNQSKRRSVKWKLFTPSRYVRWICVNDSPNRAQRRKDAKALRLYQKHLIRRETRLVEQYKRKQQRKENKLAAG